MKEQRRFELEERLADLLPEAIAIANELAEEDRYFMTTNLEMTSISDGEHLELYPEWLWQKPGNFRRDIDNECQDLLCCELSSSELQSSLGARSLLTTRKGDQIHWCITGCIDRQEIERLYALEVGRSCSRNGK